MHRLLRAALVPALILALVAGSAYGQGLVINELMASNLRTLADEDIEFSDWIELYNAGAEPVNLSDYTLSDDAAQPLRVLGVFVTAIGAGFLISSGLAYALARRLGLLRTEHAAAPSSSQA